MDFRLRCLVYVEFDRRARCFTLTFHSVCCKHNGLWSVFCMINEPMKAFSVVRLTSQFRFVILVLVLVLVGLLVQVCIEFFVFQLGSCGTKLLSIKLGFFDPVSIKLSFFVFKIGSFLLGGSFY